MRAKGLCAAHYTQKHQRGEKLEPARTERGEGDQLTVHMPRELKEATQAAADDEDIELGEWWRRAAVDRLKSKRKGRVR